MKNNSFLVFSCLFFFFTLIMYREFLYAYRMQLENFLPYYNYQNQILFYLSGEKKFDIEAPMNLRFLGLIVQFLLFKIAPCISLTNIRGDFDETYICATYSNALMNYLSLTGFLSLIFIYCYKKLNLNFSISFLSVLLSLIFFNYLEAFTLDRISIFYLLVVMFFLDKKFIAISLIFFSCLVNEKIIIVLGLYFLINTILYSKKNYLSYFFTSIISMTTLIIIFIIYSYVLDYGYFGKDNPDSIYNTVFSEGLVRIKNIFFNPKGISNSLLPIIFSLSPYIFLLFTKNKKKSFEMIIPISLIFLGMGGGTTNVGRYVMYSIPIWLPLMATIIHEILNKYYNK